MKVKNQSFEEALEGLRELHPSANPNSGFVEQLKLFGSMGCQLDQSNPGYKALRLKGLSNKILSGARISLGELSPSPLEHEDAGNEV